MNSQSEAGNKRCPSSDKESYGFDLLLASLAYKYASRSAASCAVSDASNPSGIANATSGPRLFAAHRQFGAPHSGHISGSLTIRFVTSFYQFSSRAAVMLQLSVPNFNPLWQGKIKSRIKIMIKITSHHSAEGCESDELPWAERCSLVVGALNTEVGRNSDAPRCLASFGLTPGTGLDITQSFKACAIQSKRPSSAVSYEYYLSLHETGVSPVAEWRDPYSTC